MAAQSYAEVEALFNENKLKEVYQHLESKFTEEQKLADLELGWRWARAIFDMSEGANS